MTKSTRMWHLWWLEQVDEYMDIDDVETSSSGKQITQTTYYQKHIFNTIHQSYKKNKYRRGTLNDLIVLVS